MPERLISEFVRQLHDRTLGWEELIHERAEFTLLVFEGRRISGRAAIVRELNSWKGSLYRPVVRTVERLDGRTVLIQGDAVYPIRRGHAAGRVWWVDEIRDGLVWRANGFTSERAARSFYEKGQAVG